MEEYKERILQILEEINPYVDITEESDLIGEEILDSTSILVLVTELEETYGMVIDEKLIIPERFASISTIVELIMRLNGEHENADN